MSEEVGAALRRPIHKVRLQNLKKIIKDQFGDNMSKAARAIDRSHTFMWQLYRGYRAIGEESARHIEQALKLGENTLDRKFERTRELAAYIEGQHRIYKMVPQLQLDQYGTKPKTYQACPDEHCSGNCFCAEVSTEDMVELQVGDTIFCNKDDTTAQNRKLFVVQPKVKDWEPDHLRVMRAVKLAGGRFSFTTTSKEHRVEKYDASEVKVIGRVMVVLRNL